MSIAQLRVVEYRLRSILVVAFSLSLTTCILILMTVLATRLSYLHIGYTLAEDFVHYQPASKPDGELGRHNPFCGTMLY
jgi:uncharacterized membrane protein YdbT with pleckstrin-like domain